MSFSTGERIAHVLRRLSLGAHPTLIDDLRTPEDAIARALDLTTPPKDLPHLDPPANLETATAPERIVEPVAWWIEAAITPERLIEERLAWIWHDLFATSIRKVPIPFVLWQQHLTIRTHATGSFETLLKAIARDPAMLAYLDGIHNAAGAVNENYAREVMELHTMGPGSYTQEDVYEAARAFTGWSVRIPGSRSDRFAAGIAPWQSFSVPRRHDGGSKTVLGVTADHDMDSALDVILDQPATPRFVSAQVYRALVGREPDGATIDRLSDAFGDYSIMHLVEAIVEDPAFVSDRAIRAIVRNPFERLITVAQAFRLSRPTQFVAPVLVNQQFVPFGPPNPAGYPSGAALLGPHAVVHGFDLANAVHPSELRSFDDATGFLRRLGIRDVAPTTRSALEATPTMEHRLALSINAPEMFLS